MALKIGRKRGFTLVELMIVVAIIGVLAALAIYGVQRYLRNSKTTEARANVGRIAKNASMAYDGENVEEGVVDLQGDAAVSNRFCPSLDAAVPAVAPPAQKYQSSPEDWALPGWECLKFQINDPQYYSYQYTTAGSGGTAENDTFTAFAYGDLDGDATNTSTFSLEGKVQKDDQGMVLTLAATVTELNPLE